MMLNCWFIERVTVSMGFSFVLGLLPLKSCEMNSCLVIVGSFMTENAFMPLVELARFVITGRSLFQREFSYNKGCTIKEI